LDAEKDPASQGFGPHQFDIVLASNVLHVTRDIEESVRHIRQLLAPGGWLVVEVGHDQSDEVAALIQAAGLQPGGVKADLGGVRRAVTGRKARV
ncbi:MAG: methyltransferase, partial [Tardiphaga sp.]